MQSKAESENSGHPSSNREVLLVNFVAAFTDEYFIVSRDPMGIFWVSTPSSNAIDNHKS